MPIIVIIAIGSTGYGKGARGSKQNNFAKSESSRLLELPTWVESAQSGQAYLFRKIGQRFFQTRMHEH